MSKLMSPFSTLAASAVLLSLVACSSPMPGGTGAPAMMKDGVLVTPAGMTLYTFDNDKVEGKSACNGPCATLWPPMMATATDTSTGAYSVITRDDGSKQWAYKGKPVYTYSKDTSAGMKSGDNFRNVWHVIN